MGQKKLRQENGGQPHSPHLLLREGGVSGRPATKCLAKKRWLKPIDLDNAAIVTGREPGQHDEGGTVSKEMDRPIPE